MLNRRDQFGPSVFGHADFHLPPVSAQADHREREITTQDFRFLLLKDFRFAKKYFEKRLKISCSDFRRNVILRPFGMSFPISGQKCESTCSCHRSKMFPESVVEKTLWILPQKESS